MSELNSLRPTQLVSARELFKIDSDLMVPVFAEREEHVPDCTAPASQPTSSRWPRA